MKACTAILVVAFALLASGCGGSDTVTAEESGSGGEAGSSKKAGTRETTEDFYPLTDADDPRFATVSKGQARRPGPDIDPPDRPSPEKLLIRDLEVGSGPVAKRGDNVALRYLGVSYDTGEIYYYGWLYPPSLVLRLRAPGNNEAWGEAMPGMRVGGRREVIVPAHVTKIDALDYVVELVRIEPPSKPNDAAAGSREAKSRKEANSSEKSNSDGEVHLHFPTVSDSDDPHFATITGGEHKGAKPDIDPPDHTPPKELLVRDLRVGSGAVAHPEDHVAVRYLGVDYKSGKVKYRGWVYPPRLDFELGTGAYIVAWEEGIVGMRAGGRRELVLPSHLALGTGAVDYLVELVRVEPKSSSG